jgi:hypothetical protein
VREHRNPELPAKFGGIAVMIGIRHNDCRDTTRTD